MESQKYDLSRVHGAEVFRDLPDGAKLRMDDGRVGVIIGNPHDGAIMMIRLVESADLSKIGDEEYIFYTDVSEAFD